MILSMFNTAHTANSAMFIIIILKYKKDFNL